jgi:hypothetical protein
MIVLWARAILCVAGVRLRVAIRDVVVARSRITSTAPDAQPHGCTPQHQHIHRRVGCCPAARPQEYDFQGKASCFEIERNVRRCFKPGRGGFPRNPVANALHGLFSGVKAHNSTHGTAAPFPGSLVDVFLAVVAWSACSVGKHFQNPSRRPVNRCPRSSMATSPA